MSTFYYYNTSVDKNENHEVHTGECEYLPDVLNREMIGLENNCKDAILRAKKENPRKKFDGCFFCSRSCHTG